MTEVFATYTVIPAQAGIQNFPPNNNPGNNVISFYAAQY
jgi:hypothetical protein